MNTNPYEPPSSAGEPRKTVPLLIFGVLALTLLGIGLGMALLLGSDRDTSAPVDTYEVYESMSAE